MADISMSKSPARTPGRRPDGGAGEVTAKAMVYICGGN